MAIALSRAIISSASSSPSLSLSLPSPSLLSPASPVAWRVASYSARESGALFCVFVCGGGTRVNEWVEWDGVGTYILPQNTYKAPPNHNPHTQHYSGTWWIYPQYKHTSLPRPQHPPTHTPLGERPAEVEEVPGGLVVRHALRHRQGDAAARAGHGGGAAAAARGGGVGLLLAWWVWCVSKDDEMELASPRSDHPTIPHPQSTHSIHIPTLQQTLPPPSPQAQPLHQPHRGPRPLHLPTTTTTTAAVAAPRPRRCKWLLLLAWALGLAPLGKRVGHLTPIPGGHVEQRDVVVAGRQPAVPVWWMETTTGPIIISDDQIDRSIGGPAGLPIHMHASSPTSYMRTRTQ